MATFDIHSEFDFGKYSGKTLKEVFQKDPGYIEWCMKKVTFFDVDKSTLNEFEEINPHFRFSSKALSANRRKNNASDDPEETFDPWENYGQSYDLYGGGPTGDLSDDFIDDVLDGEPDAYWNID